MWTQVLFIFKSLIVSRENKCMCCFHVGLSCSQSAVLVSVIPLRRMCSWINMFCLSWNNILVLLWTWTNPKTRQKCLVDNVFESPTPALKEYSGVQYKCKQTATIFQKKKKRLIHLLFSSLITERHLLMNFNWDSF